MKNSKAEMGAGTLVIFIALLLVAAVAAAVLLQTAGSLQSKALGTGQQTRSEISTNLKVMEILASDASDGNVESIETVLRLSPGSDPISLEDTLIRVTTHNDSTSYTYSGSDAYLINATSATYGATYLVNSTNHIDGYIARGDVAELTLNFSRSLLESEKVQVNILPKSGHSTEVSFFLPDVLSENLIYVYP